MTLRRSLLVLALQLIGAACGASGPDGVRAVNIGFPSSREMGALGVDPGGRVFAQVGAIVWELTGAIEEDTQVWRQQAAFADHQVSWGVPGYGAVARDGRVWRSLTTPSAEPLPYLEGVTVFTPLLVEPSGVALAVGTQDLAVAELYRRAPGGTWTKLEGTRQRATIYTSAVRVEDGRVFAFHGSSVFELPPGLATASVAYGCDTRALGSCGGNASIQSFARRLPDGRMVFFVLNPQAEIYAFAPGDAELTRLARVGPGPIGGQLYEGRSQGLAVSGSGDVFMALRTEQSGGEVHLLAHRPGDAEDAWVRVVVGLPRVVTYLQDDAGSMWLWDSSDTNSGLWKVISADASCRVCGE